MARMKIPIKCPKCNSTKVHTETAQEITRYYRKGKLIKKESLPTPRRCFCDNTNCSHEFEFDGKTYVSK